MLHLGDSPGVVRIARAGETTRHCPRPETCITLHQLVRRGFHPFVDGPHTNETLKKLGIEPKGVENYPDVGFEISKIGRNEGMSWSKRALRSH